MPAINALPTTDARLASICTIQKRVTLLVRRFLRARTYGVCFTGTSSFRMPNALRLNGRTIKLAAPEEIGAGLDFINLALDDEYGLGSLSLRPRTILDIGANFGLFSLLAAHHCPGSRIHAYEPNPRVFPYAVKNLSLVSGVAVFPAAVGSRPGLALVHDESDSRYAKTIVSENGNIEITALRTAIERLGGSVDLLKLDCEGAEWDLFQDPTAFERVKLIRMEYHLIGGRCLDNLTSSVQRLGFQVDRLLQNRGFGIAWLSKNT